MKRLLKTSLLALVMILCAITAQAQRYVVINGNNVCIRSSASLSNNKIGHENKGSRFPYIGTYGSFYCINYYGSYGYVHKSYSYIAGQGSTGSRQTFVKVQGYNVRIRTAPSLRASICGKADWGDSFVYLGHVNGWYKIKYGGYTRYISDEFSSL